MGAENNEPERSEPGREKIIEAAAVIARGGLVCMPTETTYGIAADIAQPAALAALVELKGRAANAPFALVVADIAEARALASPWPESAEALARAHWPGPLTLVVPARPGLPAELVGPGGGVGVRISNHPVANGLANAVGGPITATSANPSGRPPAISIAMARDYFAERLYYLDGDGRAPGASRASDESDVMKGMGGGMRGGASTVVAVAADGAVRVLRKGPITIVRDS